jgi:hypothetical protein
MILKGLGVMLGFCCVSGGIALVMVGVYFWPEAFAFVV